MNIRRHEYKAVALVCGASIAVGLLLVVVDGKRRMNRLERE